jgi:hypothetical protein
VVDIKSMKEIARIPVGTLSEIQKTSIASRSGETSPNPDYLETLIRQTAPLT